MRERARSGMEDGRGAGTSQIGDGLALTPQRSNPRQAKTKLEQFRPLQGRAARRRLTVEVAGFWPRLAASLPVAGSGHPQFVACDFPLVDLFERDRVKWPAELYKGSGGFRPQLRPYGTIQHFVSGILI